MYPSFAAECGPEPGSPGVAAQPAAAPKSPLLFPADAASPTGSPRGPLYRAQVAAWQEAEADYLRHPQWCEHRVVILLQEAFRPNYQRLRRARAAGELSEQQYAQRLADLAASLRSVKAEYRRTLQRLHDRAARPEELASLASKAVACVASVFPWSSGGFEMTYEENIAFGRATALAPAPATPPSRQHCRSNGGAPPGVPPPSPLRLVAGRAGGARPPLTPLPPRKERFVRSVAADGSVVLAAAVEWPKVVLPALSPPPVATASGFPSPQTTPGSPARQLPLSITGPIRPDEMRYFDKKQVVQTARLFSARSLAGVPFIGSRRAAVVQLQRATRLQPQPPALSSPCGDNLAGSFGSASFASSIAGDTASVASDCGTQPSSRCSRRDRHDYLSGLSLLSPLPSSHPDHAFPLAVHVTAEQRRVASELW